MRNLLIVAGLAGGTLLWGQGPGAPPTDLVKSYLTLTDAQIQSLTQIRQQGASSRMSIMQDIHTKQQALHDALDKGGASAMTLGQYLLDIQALQKKISDLDTTDRQLALNVLNDAQKTKVAALQTAADLAPTIGQAQALGLLTRPANAAGAPGGPGMGPMMQRGPAPMMQRMHPGM